MRSIKQPIPAISVFCLALLVRVFYNLTVADSYTPTFDAGVYNILANNLIHIHCYCRALHHSTTFRPPLWPFILATIYFFAGEHNEYARLLYCVLDSITCVFAYLIASDLFGKRIALITGIIAATYVGLFVWTGWLYTETLYTFCLTALIFSLHRLQQHMLAENPGTGKTFLTVARTEWRWIIVGGIFLGLTLLTRPTGSILIGLLCIWAVFLITHKVLLWRVAVKNVFILLSVALLLNVPWFYRNYLVTHTFFPVSAIGTTLVGNYDDNVLLGHNVIRGMWAPPEKTINPDFHDYTLADEQSDTAKAFIWMRTHLSEVPILLGLHVLNMWTPYLYAHGLPFEQIQNRPSSQIMFYLIPIASIPVFLLAAVGLVVTWKRKKHLLVIVYLVIVLTILQNIAFYGSPRYRAPIEPLLVVLVGGALWWWMGNEDEVGAWRHFRSSKANAQEVTEGIQSAQEVEIVSGK
ncbi:ArnT family glycosyltransferase [Dictyobacter arantiisoli]|uniref:Glycosyltransferase RgtA/B/C/D-like domain-containing protein n=1 Tax=Dictyobacter arantiisoli TaxID=2014874 RepID=A0A5A5T6C8_9CHLR|nr:glycosyltransferase family 39 protein [Dictyobacter arantiisoli]GCF07011.1 hypothetical protein KDI_05750 [Dictyobacter arantiisoli]